MRSWLPAAAAAAACLLGLLGPLGCARGDAPPAALDVRNDTCGSCRMPVSDAKLAAQIAAPGEEARFFDDIGCLRDYLSADARGPAGSIAYVADHRTGQWIPVSRAVFSRCRAVETPMGSHLIAHTDAASRAADPSESGCAEVTAADIFGRLVPPGSRKGA
jgi:copper chaperone NosL